MSSISKNKIFRNYILYLIVLLGIFFIYLVPFKGLLPGGDVDPNSKVEFIYQQF